jgi:hypothetical protein
MVAVIDKFIQLKFFYCCTYVTCHSSVVIPMCYFTESLASGSKHFAESGFRCSGSALVKCGFITSSLHIPIQIRKQRAKAMRIRIRIQILVRLCRHKKFDFDKKNILYVGNVS